MLKGLGNWLRKVSWSRMLRRIDRLMGLSDMKLGRKTRRYFMRLRRNLDMTNSLLKANEAVSNTILNMAVEISVMWCMGSITIMKIFCEILRVSAPIIFVGIFAFPVLLVLMVFNSPSIYRWPARYRSVLAHTGVIGKVMDRLWKNSVETNNDEFVGDFFDGFNRMASILQVDMDELDEPKYWSDEDYGRFMRIILSYSFIYESADEHPDKNALSEFINSDEIQNTAREVLDDVRKRKNRICGIDTSEDTNTEESSSTIENKPDPVIVSQTNDRTDPNIIRSEDIQSRIVGKTDRLHNILDSEMQIEKMNWNDEERIEYSAAELAP